MRCGFFIYVPAARASLSYCSQSWTFWRIHRVSETESDSARARISYGTNCARRENGSYSGRTVRPGIYLDQVHRTCSISNDAWYPAPARRGANRRNRALAKNTHPFTDRQIELVTTFAAQAVIAIENARLLNDLNKLNQQLEQRVTDQVSEIERMGRLRRFLPPQVADLIVASGTEKQ